MSTMVRASGIQGYALLMRELGVEPEPLLQRFRLSEALLEDSDALIPLQSAMLLLETSATQANCPDLGLRLAKDKGVQILGSVGILINSAKTVREAMNYANRFLFVHSPGFVISINDFSDAVEGCAEIVVEVRHSGTISQRQTMDLTLGVTHRIAAFLAGKNYHLKAVMLPHTPIVPMGRYEAFFDAPVYANQIQAALHIDRAVLDSATAEGNPHIRQITEDYLLANFRVPSESVSSRVRLALRQTLGSEHSDKISIASMLAMHPRTLQRRLVEEGSSYSSIKTELRKELALQYLKQTNMSLGQLSGLLGFPEQSAFSRACQAWFGDKPSAVRASLHSPGGR